LEEKPEFSDLVASVWKSNEFNLEPSAMRRLVGKLKSLKHKVIGWEKVQKKLKFLKLEYVEEELEKSYNFKISGRDSMDIDIYIKELEGKRKKYILDKEETWRQKSRAIWLQQGDQNTIFFHHYASHMKNKNAIWEMKDELGISHIG